MARLETVIKRARFVYSPCTATEMPTPEGDWKPPLPHCIAFGS